MIVGYQYKLDKGNFHCYINDLKWFEVFFLKMRGYKVTEIKKPKCDIKCEFATEYDGEPIGECHCMETWKKCDAENCNIPHKTKTENSDEYVRSDNNAE